MQNTNSKTRTLVECALLLAIASILSFFPKFEGIWVNGGSITLCSMLPIILISYRHGLKWGLASGVAFSLIQMITGGIYLPAGNVLVALVGLLLDYILPYTLIGLGGLFRWKFKGDALALISGSAFVLVLRYLCHVASGYILWRSLAAATKFLSTDGFALGHYAISAFSGDALCLVYSFIYNGSYMLPELIITCIGASVIARFAWYGLKKPTNA